MHFGLAGELLACNEFCKIVEILKKNETHSDSLIPLFFTSTSPSLTRHSVIFINSPSAMRKILTMRKIDIEISTRLNKKFSQLLCSLSLGI